jgi:hypothetical protein
MSDQPIFDEEHPPRQVGDVVASRGLGNKYTIIGIGDPFQGYQTYRIADKNGNECPHPGAPPGQPQTLLLVASEWQKCPSSTSAVHKHGDAIVEFINSGKQKTEREEIANNFRASIDDCTLEEILNALVDAKRIDRTMAGKNDHYVAFLPRKKPLPEGK